MNHPLELRIIFSYLILLYNFRGTFVSFFTLLGFFVLLLYFILLDLFNLNYLLPQALTKWGIGRAMGGANIFFTIFWRKSQIALIVFMIKILFFNN